MVSSSHEQLTIICSVGFPDVYPVTGCKGPEGEYKYCSTLSLTSAHDGVGGQGHTLATIPPGKRPAACCTGGWVDPRASMNGCGKFCPHSRIQSLDHPTCSKLLYQLHHPSLKSCILWCGFWKWVSVTTTDWHCSFLSWTTEVRCWD
jgi:hypothetical protein